MRLKPPGHLSFYFGRGQRAGLSEGDPAWRRTIGIKRRPTSKVRRYGMRFPVAADIPAACAAGASEVGGIASSVHGPGYDPPCRQVAKRTRLVSPIS